MKSEAKKSEAKRSEAKKGQAESKAMLFLEVTGVIVAYIAIIASLAYPVVTASGGGA